MHLKIASRKSDLARLQAYMVGDALKRHHPYLQIEYGFRSSLGDQNQDDPLWKMPSQGVFTQDFRADLNRGHVDMVVHSWKDLPTQDDGSTSLAATLKRADHRDLLLIKKDAVEAIKARRSLRLLSSSPRRMYNLPPFLARAFPGGLDDVSFELVRGNIQTRLDKLFRSQADGLVVAKAAIDRLGNARRFNQPGDNFDRSSSKIAAAIKNCQWMVLPASQNPPAAAQGALVVEIKPERQDLAELLGAVNCQATFNDVMLERANLALYGGGCHQKIGVWVQTRNEGKVFCLRGKTDAGEELNEFLLHRAGQTPLDMTNAQSPEAENLIAVNSEIAPTRPNNIDSNISWTANVPQWFELAGKGIWVNGSDDNLGANEDKMLDFLLNGARAPIGELSS